MRKLRTDILGDTAGGANRPPRIDNFFYAHISLYAHADVFIEANTALAYSSANLRQVKIDFLPPPEAIFSYTPTKPLLGDSITFDTTDSVCPEGQICSYIWDFGDDTTGTGEIVSKTFNDVGEYTVIFTLTDEYGQEDTCEKKFRIAPALYVFPKAWLFTTVKINGEDRPGSGPLSLGIGNNSIATANLDISSIALTEDDDDIFDIYSNPCSGTSLSPGFLCPGYVTIGLMKIQEGRAKAVINYNSLSGEPCTIPLIHKIYSVETEEEYERIKQMSKTLRDVVINGSVDPTVMTFPDNISDYEAIGGKDFYFKEGKNGDNISDITEIHFMDSIDVENNIPGMPFISIPFSVSIQMAFDQPKPTETERITLVDFLQIDGGNSWFVFVEEDDYDIDGTPVEALKFIFFRSDGIMANGYSVIYSKDSDYIFEMTEIFGSTNVMDMTPYKSDSDIDIDVDGKNLANFASKYMAGDLFADLNSDGLIDKNDLDIFASEFGH
ncbi:MAG: PKD domain-containing protein [Desulfobacula sp.]|uniref:PKD domain-containing protein n=1 Tax=Desulfobacula sp. TaxID=2593537 RepID=UPI0025C04ACF|nr:PKD domain-containing protein [Desulfobacula sp.]MCD4718665.1 PKD domain-containing protein [Desulfobacula sp.]